MLRMIWLGLAGFALIAVSTPAPAQTKATKDEITAAFVGNTATFSDGAKGIYAADGTFTHSAGSAVNRGKYTINDGEICVVYPNGFKRCDTIVKDGQGFALVNSGGMRFSIKLSSGAIAPPEPSKVSASEITAAFVGKTAIFSDGTELKYSDNGDYRWSKSGQSSSGKYTISDGQICVDFSDGRKRCDMIVKDGSGYAMVTRQGQQFSLKLK